MQLHRLSLVVENIQLPYETDFSVSLSLCNSDWTSTGNFHQSVLPAGSTCSFMPTEESISAGQVPVDMRIESEMGVHSGTLAIVKRMGTAEFTSRGSTALFNEKNQQDVLLVSILLVSELIRAPSPPAVLTTQCQTETALVAESSSQTAQIAVADQTVQTGARVVEENDLAHAVVHAIRRHIGRDRENRRKRNGQERGGKHPPDPTPPPTQPLGLNVVPRLQRLTLLDQMINNRERLLNAMESTLQHSEVRRKMEFIQSQREEKGGKKEETEEKATETEEADVKTEEKKVAFREDTLEESVGSSGTTSESSSSTGTDSGSVSGSELSTSSSEASFPETVVLALPQKPQLPASSSSSSSIEDPFSPRPPRARRQSGKQEEPELTPTSQYIQKLREQILEERRLKS